MTIQKGAVDKIMEAMPILARDKNQLTFIYSSASDMGKQILGYVHGSSKKVQTIDIAKEELADTVWIELLKDLEMSFCDVLATELIEDNDKSQDFETDDWLKLINGYPQLLQRPIAISGDKVILLSHRSEILKFFGVDSAGLEKTMHHEPPTTSSKTDDETFI